MRSKHRRTLLSSRKYKQKYKYNYRYVQIQLQIQLQIQVQVQMRIVIQDYLRDSNHGRISIIVSFLQSHHHHHHLQDSKTTELFAKL